MLPDPVLRRYRLEDGRSITVVRDDLLPGGSKVRYILPQLKAGEEYVFGGPAEGYAQIALARACELARARATFFIAERKILHERT